MVIYTIIDKEPETALNLSSLLDVSDMSVEICVSNMSIHSTQCNFSLYQG
jgi:hypothetical protein